MALFRDVPKPPAWPAPRDQRSMSAVVDYARRRDPMGHVVHTALAGVYLFLLPLTTAPKDVAFAVLAGYALARLHCTWRSYTFLLRDRLALLLAAWTAWNLLSLLWSDNRAEGLDQLGAFRVVATGLMIWPVITGLPWLLGSFLAGVLATNGVQLAQTLEWFGLRPDYNRRLDGLMHPIHVGSVCAAALCWHLAAVLNARGWLRAVSVAGLAAAGAGLLFSGSRGPWIGAAAAVALLLVIEPWRRPALRKPVIVIVIVTVTAAVATWPLTNDFVTFRTRQAVSDLEVALEGGLDTNLGARFASWHIAWQMFLDAPVHGAGAGGFNGAVHEYGYDEKLPTLATSQHAHSMYMQELGATGLVGLGLCLGVVGLALARSFRDHADTPWTEGTPYALVGWAVAAMFDAYHHNGHMFGLFAFMVTMVTPLRPPVAIRLRAARPRAAPAERTVPARGASDPHPAAPPS